MINRFLLLAGLVTTSLSAAPLTIVFTGNATGTVGATGFTNQPFTITFNSDTTSVVKGTTCCANDYTTPSGTAATFSMGTGGSGSFSDDQAVFVNQTEQSIGIWHHNTPDYLTIGNPVFATYTESSSLGATSGTTFVYPEARSMITSKGALVLTSVTGVSVTVTVGTGTPKTPVVSSIDTVYTKGVGISQNTWVAITGTNLVPEGTPAGGFNWTGSASFASGQMPTALNGVTVTVNGKPAYVEFYCATGGTNCPKDQINILTPLDATTGPVQVVVSNGSLSSSATTVTMSTVSPSLFLWDGSLPNVTATHGDYSILGALTLYPGLSKPASVNETIVLWTTGFGLPKDALVAGSNTQSSPLPTLPTCQINGAAATVSYAGVASPGLYQLNVVVPNGASNGDNKVRCSYGGVSTQDNLNLAVAR